MTFSYNELSKHKHMFYIKLGGGFFEAGIVICQ